MMHVTGCDGERQTLWTKPVESYPPSGCSTPRLTNASDAARPASEPASPLRASSARSGTAPAPSRWALTS
eukprot:4046097-Prymnesium_polylepis.1